VSEAKQVVREFQKEAASQGGGFLTAAEVNETPASRDGCSRLQQLR